MIAGFSLRTLALGVVAAGLITSHLYAYRQGEKRVEGRWAIQKAKDTLALDQAKKAALEAQNALQQRIDTITVEKNREIRALERQRDALFDSVRNRPERATPTNPGAPACTGCTGQGLARGDAEFLIGYAADAAKLAAALNQCKKAYDEVHRRLSDP